MSNRFASVVVNAFQPDVPRAVLLSSYVGNAPMTNSHVKPIKFKPSKKEIKKIEYEYDTMIKTAEINGTLNQEVSAFFRREEELLWAHIRQAKTSVLQQRFVQSILNNP